MTVMAFALAQGETRKRGLICRRESCRFSKEADFKDSSRHPALSDKVRKVVSDKVRKVGFRSNFLKRPKVQTLNKRLRPGKRRAQTSRRHLNPARAEPVPCTRPAWRKASPRPWSMLEAWFVSC